MRRDLRVCCIGLLTAATGVYAAPVGDYAYGYPLTIAPGASAYIVDLPADAYAWARLNAGLADIVVADADGRGVPFGRYTDAPPSPKPVEFSARLLPVPVTAEGAEGARIQRNANGDIVIDPGKAAASAKPSEWLIDAKRSITLDTLLFAPQSVDASISMNVEGSDDLQHWDRLATDMPVVTLKRGDDTVDERSLRIGGEPARYFRIRITQGEAPWTDGDAAASTVKITGEVLDTGGTEDERRQWADGVVTTPVPVASKTGGVDYDYRLPAALPVDSVRVTLDSDDSVARFDVHSIAEDGLAEALGELSVTKGGADAKPVVTFEPKRRLVIRLHSSVALRKPPKLAAGWVPDRFVFLPEGKAPYRLLAGSYMARRPDYPVTDAITSLRTANGEDWKPAVATIGPRQDAAGPSALEAPKVPYDWTKPLLWVVLIGGAALVAGMAVSLLRKPRDTTP
ncbi:uncharacterized protein DUF3999 [Luteibacter rhizovicinus]|uniref:Uncharacterized protein DUF3999 n=1 Tax=Luteibacter rhizovicinus TaxID=242606 RepID=A0A4R3YLQ0_9GAMM|nr:DUF3999 family protein [Luteibacter rhizovicinus]TCV93151.1 uncharacterized protein DUF3999 [Luteibacter rhizovicinus]